MTAVRFVVPLRPVGVNAQYRAHRGGVHKTDAARAFAGAVAVYGAKARRAARVETTTDPVDVLIRFYFADERPDGDGPVKSVLDALQIPSAKGDHPGAGFIANDRQVRDHHVQRRIDRERPRVEVTVGPAGEVFTLGALLEQGVTGS